MLNVVANLVENEYGWPRDVVSENFSKLECQRFSEILADQHQINLNELEVGTKIVNLELILYLIIYIII